MRIAVIGTGISGLVAAHLLAEAHDLTVFEAADYPGGHTHTHTIEHAGRSYRIDSGFIVFNDWTYRNFVRLMEKLGVASQPSSMSFSVRCEKTGLEYNGTSRNTLFAQRSNLFRPSFWRMIRDILRFNREALALLRHTSPAEMTLGEFLRQRGYSRQFAEYYIRPMGQAVWSADDKGIEEFPARFFMQFFKNHGFLSIDERPVWRVITGGSASYVEPLTASFRHRIRLRTPVRGVRRHADRVEVVLPDGRVLDFDHVILATHSDQALRLLEDPTDLERTILGAIPYRANEAVLHTDERMMPRRRLAWAAWNYNLPLERRSDVTVTYNMNILQGLDAPVQFMVTLNRGDEIDPSKVLRRMTYDHPVFTLAGAAAQARHAEISGSHRTHYCGAYWGYGFHEDGVKSGIAVARGFGGRFDSSDFSLRP